MVIRELLKTDIEDILDVRTSTKENHFSLRDLEQNGIDKKSVTDWLDGSIKGWVCETSGRIVGFAMGNSQSAEVLVIALLPEYENLGIGQRLMAKVQNWLWSFSHDHLWLWSNPDSSVRAHGFYRKLGWRPTGESSGNNEKLKLFKSQEF